MFQSPEQARAATSPRHALGVGQCSVDGRWARGVVRDEDDLLLRPLTRKPVRPGWVVTGKRQ
jgi:hypothetical protein